MEGGVRVEKSIYCVVGRPQCKKEMVHMIADVQRLLAEWLFATHVLETWWSSRQYVSPVNEELWIDCFLESKTAVLALVGKGWHEEFAKWKEKEVARVTAEMWRWSVPLVVSMCTVRGYRPESVAALERTQLMFVPDRSELKVELWVQEREVVAGLFVRKGQLREHRFKAMVCTPQMSSTWWRRETAADAWECGLDTIEQVEAVLAWKDEMGESLGSWVRAQSALFCASV